MQHISSAEMGLSIAAFDRTLELMMTSSNGNIFRVTGHLCGPGEFPTKKPVTQSFNVFFDLRLNKNGWVNNGEAGWFVTLSRPLWRHRNGV